jgi:hypothetical protein
VTVFNGYLFSKLAAIGTKSEGPKYFLQQADYHELVVCKKVEHWQKDPVLHPHLDFKVVIEGELLPDGIHYVSIKVASVESDSSPEPEPAGMGGTPFETGEGILPLACSGPSQIGAIDVTGVLHAYRMILFGQTAVAIAFGQLRLFIDYRHATIVGTVKPLPSLDGKKVRVIGCLAIVDLTGEFPTGEPNQVVIVATKIQLV